MVNDPVVRPFAEVDGVAVSLLVTEEGAAQHCGLIHRIDEEEPRHVHLAWHHQLRSEPPTDDYFWVDPASFESAEKRIVAMLARQIGDRREPIPYALSNVGLRFDEAGQLAGIRTGQGFTCATFVLAVFASYGYDLVERATWPLNANDDWQAWVVDTLEKPGSRASPEHVAAVKQQIGGQRVRPGEVAGAASAAETPVVFDDAQKLAAEIIAEVQQLRSARAA